MRGNPSVKVEVFPRAEADIVHQFPYYLVDQAAPAAVRFREAAIESMEQLRSHPRMGSLFRGSSPCRGATPFGSICYKEVFLSMYELLYQASPRVTN